MGGWEAEMQQAMQAGERSKAGAAPDDGVADVVRVEEDGLGAQAQSALELGQALPIA